MIWTKPCIFSICISLKLLPWFTLCLLHQLKQFKADNSDVGFGSGTLALDQSIERTIANIKWVEENKENVLDWFTTEANAQWRSCFYFFITHLKMKTEVRSTWKCLYYIITCGTKSVYRTFAKPRFDKSWTRKNRYFKYYDKLNWYIRYLKGTYISYLWGFILSRIIILQCHKSLKFVSASTVSVFYIFNTRILQTFILFFFFLLWDVKLSRIYV